MKNKVIIDRSVLKKKQKPFFLWVILCLPVIPATVTVILKP